MQLHENSSPPAPEKPPASCWKSGQPARGAGILDVRVGKRAKWLGGIRAPALEHDRFSVIGRAGDVAIARHEYVGSASHDGRHVLPADAHIAVRAVENQPDPRRIALHALE